MPTSLSSGVDISKVPGCHLLPQMGYQVTVTKITSRIGVCRNSVGSTDLLMCLTLEILTSIIKTG